MMYWHGNGAWVGWAAMSLTMVLFWGLAVVGAYWAIRGISASPHVVLAPASRQQSRALETLDERYAAGEIDDDDYRRLLATLREKK